MKQLQLSGYPLSMVLFLLLTIAMRTESGAELDHARAQVAQEEGPRRFFQCLLGKEVTVEEFFINFWEQRHLHVKRGRSNFYGNILSLKDVMRYVGRGRVSMARSNLRVCKYKDGVRRERRIRGTSASELKRQICRGYTAQIFSPQHLCTPVAAVCAQLEQVLHSLVGSSLYVTPSHSQGLAPHHDDVDVFVFQLHGRKRWRLYAPKVRWPKSYSRDMRDKEIGEPVLDVVLKPGDLLYMPRGTVHQASTRSSPSIHLTISAYQHQAWDDLLLAALPYAVRQAAEEEQELRRSIPLDTLRVLGMAHGVVNRTCERRESLLEKARNLTHRLAESMTGAVDKAVDLMAADFICGRMPRKFADVVLRAHQGKETRVLEQPRLSASNQTCTIQKEKARGKHRQLSHHMSFNKTFWLTSSLCMKEMSRKRLIMEDEHDRDGDHEGSAGCTTRVRLSIISDLNNERKYHMRESNMGKLHRFKLPGKYIEALGDLFSRPNAIVRVKDLRLPCDEDKVILANILVAQKIAALVH
ncbi:hypothetical protein GUITHDRAFT_137055 [Guillardia theta CCMP2712]|uniref:Bifunctional lysine-specific demethylase and histidyl-hydroxylase n=2 Tax=Guillardia theta TaxID=55529 RepID=L1JIF6_GUITC|nr:hypothetical protein GUITHDRAFT_137055 [Guillardia theta CCMP2712]EKX48112.1 hypothetical protein GUITHDRAFT_137055 [Guillardia theta CCMP2712]|mmetsp:Transcript_10284/g.34286  ORF Transcript_10284/g.34286 Transcript_10284/m.34286 type:complete len:526 (+) Transcript_10284:146-1723(+)|eukprot:XP_005835092.1 hypothetical protein GUITHDRAFT_137055 [Guillardia theta CCMP2712]